MGSVERVETSARDETEEQLSVFTHAEKSKAATVIGLLFLQ